MATPDLKKEDLRVRRTHKLLSEALFALLADKPFDEIFVTDICERAMVHRTTFYKHFEDKYHLLEFCLKELIARFEEETSKITSAERNMKDYYMNLIRQFLLYMMENKEMYMIGIFNIGNNSVISMFNRSINNLIVTKLTENEKVRYHHTIPIPIIARFYTGALISTATWWLENDTPISIDEMVYSISLLINETNYIK